MKSAIQLVFLFILFACCKDKNPSPQEPAGPLDSTLVGTWKLESVTTATGSVTTNPTAKELYTTFAADTNLVSFTNNESEGKGFYTIKGKGQITFIISRNDRGGWPNGPWLDLYLENMNKARSYTVTTSELRIVTSERKTLFFTKQ